MVQLKGIDVSEHNGVIDWNKVKADGVKFAMIRMGYGGDHKSQDDEQFERNVAECERLGIPWGAYLYSYALTIADVKSEVKHAFRLLKGKTPNYPIAFDMEDADGYKAKHGMPSNSTLVDICYEFLLEVEKAGYYVNLYANLSWLNNQLKSSKLDRFDKWVAQWGSKCTYGKSFGMWQYTNSGTVNGIKGRVDMNFAYHGVRHPNQTPVKPAAKPTAKGKVIQRVKALVRGDIRKGPSHTAPYYRDHMPGEVFDVYKRKGDWHCVGGENGVEYWIDGNKGKNLYWIDNPALKK